MERISKIETFYYYPNNFKNLLLCRIETDDGAYGWGEAFVMKGKEKAVEAYLQAIAPCLIDRDPHDIRHFYTTLYNDNQDRRINSDFGSAWSAIEIALWDIVGKYANQPVHNMLGGKQRESIRVYANGWNYGLKTVEKTVERALAIKEQGFTALKWDPFFSPRRHYISQKDEDLAIENVRSVRDALGKDMDLLIEGGRRLSPYHAIRFIRKIEQYNLFLIDEPCLGENIDLLAEVRRNVSARIMTGETFFTKSEFVQCFEKRAADVINPEVCAYGGILASLEIAAMAEPYNVAFSPHNYNGSIVALAASLQLCAMASNFIIAEFFVGMKPGCDAIDVNPIKIEEGFAELPKTPGIGIDIDLQELKKHSYHSLTAAKTKSVYMEYPHKSDIRN
jgi:galactonate dehydratase